MKKLLIIFLLFANISYAFNSGLNVELSYIYFTFIVVVILIIGIDKGIKFVHKKQIERDEIFNEQSHFDL
jgi:predicted RND superfamily exporter protein